MSRRFESAKRMNKPASDPSRQLVPGTEYHVQPGGGGGFSVVPPARSNGSPRGGARSRKPSGFSGRSRPGTTSGALVSGLVTTSPGTLTGAVAPPAPATVGAPGGAAVTGAVPPSPAGAAAPAFEPVSPPLDPFPNRASPSAAEQPSARSTPHPA